MNYYDNEVLNPDNITQEIHHCTKIISHELQFQCELRRKKEHDAALSVKNKLHN